MTFSERFLEALHYEQWLRFYFLEDASAPDAGEATAVIVVPENAAARSRREEPQLSGILEGLRGHDVSMERSRSVIFQHLAEAAGVAHDGAELAQAVAQLAEEDAFRRGIDLFQSWVQELADGETSVEVHPSGEEETQERTSAGDLKTVGAAETRKRAGAGEYAPCTEASGKAEKCPAGTEAAHGAGTEGKKPQAGEGPSFRTWEKAFRAWSERQYRLGK